MLCMPEIVGSSKVSRCTKVQTSCMARNQSQGQDLDIYLGYVRSKYKRLLQHIYVCSYSKPIVQVEWHLLYGQRNEDRLIQ